MSKDAVFSGPYFPVFSANTGKHGPEKTPYLGTFHAVNVPSQKFDRVLNTLLDDIDKSGVFYGFSQIY